jgi:lipoyl synthase
MNNQIQKKKIRLSALHDVKKILRTSCVNTVCEEARCPNISECFSKRTATFMIMGDTCTRNCKFCNVNSGKPLPLDKDEPERIANTSKSMELKHVVLTSVTRDDLLDGGAKHFAATVGAVKSVLPSASIEVLTPDFKNDLSALDMIFASRPDVFNHNIETVERLSGLIRPEASYKTSLSVLSYMSSKGLMVKSGFMLGLGETEDEIYKTMADIKKTGVDILTIGQYFRPRLDLFPVSKFYSEKSFEDFKNEGYKLGFKYVFSAPYVRSSYMAEEVFFK